MFLPSPSCRLSLGAWLVLALGVGPTASSPEPPLAPEVAPVKLRVQLPADAELEINGVRMKTTGDMRRFSSDPLPVEEDHSYVLKATWRGKTVVRTLMLRPGKVYTVDFREQLQRVESPPPGSFHVPAPPAIAVEAGKEAPVVIRIERERLEAPVALSFSGLPPHVSISPKAAIAVGLERWQGMLTAAGEAAAGAVEIKVEARAGDIHKEAAFRLTVTRPLPPALTLTLPATVELAPTGRKTIAIGVKRERFEGPVTVEFEGLPRGITLPAVTVPGGAPAANQTVMASAEAPEGTSEVRALGRADAARAATTFRLTVKGVPAVAKPMPPARLPFELVLPRDLVLEPGQVKFVRVEVRPGDAGTFQAAPTVRLDPAPGNQLTFTLWSESSHVRSYAVHARPDAPAGEIRVSVDVTAGALQSQDTFTVTVRKPGDKAGPKPEPQAEGGLELILPGEVVLAPGQVKHVQVRVGLLGVGPSDIEPSVRLEVPAGRGIASTPWSASRRVEAPDYLRGYALKANSDASEGKTEIKVLVSAGRVKAEGTFAVRVKKPPASLP